jgi:hypothetical protein
LALTVLVFACSRVIIAGWPGTRSSFHTPNPKMTDTSQARAIDDTGEKIGGARKDWRERAMVAADLDDMTDAEAVEIVNKDNVWPQPDWEDVVAAGMPADVAAHIKIIRDRMAKTPHSSAKEDAGHVRRDYVEMVSMLRERLMAARSVDGVKAVYTQAIAKLGDRAVRSDPATRRKLFSVYQGRACPFVVAYGDPAKVRTMVSEGFPSKIPAWRKGREALSGRRRRCLRREEGLAGRPDLRE